MNPQSELKNSMYQDGGSNMADCRWSVKFLKILKTLFLPEIDYSGVLKLTDPQLNLTNFMIQDGGFKMADSIWR